MLKTKQRKAMVNSLPHPLPVAIFFLNIFLI